MFKVISLTGLVILFAGLIMSFKFSDRGFHSGENVVPIVSNTSLNMDLRRCESLSFGINEIMLPDESEFIIKSGVIDLALSNDTFFACWDYNTTCAIIWRHPRDNNSQNNQAPYIELNDGSGTVIPNAIVTSSVKDGNLTRHYYEKAN